MRRFVGVVAVEVSVEAPAVGEDSVEAAAVPVVDVAVAQAGPQVNASLTAYPCSSSYPLILRVDNLLWMKLIIVVTFETPASGAY